MKVVLREGSRIQVAQTRLRGYLLENPNVSLSHAMRWLNNQRSEEKEDAREWWRGHPRRETIRPVVVRTTRTVVEF